MTFGNCKSKGLLAIFAVVISIVLAGSATAQTGSATIQGTVTDQQGAVVAGATVKLVNESRGFNRTAVTSSSGAYSFSSVPPDTYQLTVEANGFKKLVQSSVTALVDKTTSIDAISAVRTAPDMPGGVANGNQPSAEVTARVMAAFELPPHQIGGPGCWRGRGRIVLPRAVHPAPSPTTDSPVQARRTTSIASSRRAPRSSKSAPRALNSDRRYPAATPTVSRPPLNTSSVASVFAARSGGRYART